MKNSATLSQVATVRAHRQRVVAALQSIEADRAFKKSTQDELDALRLKVERDRNSGKDPRLPENAEMVAEYVRNKLLAELLVSFVAQNAFRGCAGNSELPQATTALFHALLEIADRQLEMPDSSAHATMRNISNDLEATARGLVSDCDRICAIRFPAIPANFPHPLQSAHLEHLRRHAQIVPPPE